MLRLGRYVVKTAETDEEFAQIHRLNYRTFVQEIGQHIEASDGSLVDKFHEKNTYILAMREGRLVGMLSAHDQPPFSIASRLAKPELIRRPGMKPLEVRLLAIEPEERHSPVIAMLVYQLFRFGREHGHTHFVISGVTDQIDLYKHIGFEALGPAVGRSGVQFVPMIASLDRVEAQMQRTMTLWERRISKEIAATEPVFIMHFP